MCFLRLLSRTITPNRTSTALLSTIVVTPSMTTYYCGPGRSATRDGAVKAIVVCGRRIIDERLQSTRYIRDMLEKN